MRAAFENIPLQKGEQAFHVFRLAVPAFEFNWHYHPEYELTLIKSGTGKRMVGDSYAAFDSGDLVLTGSGLPHTWASEKKNNKKAVATAVVIQFSANLFEPLLHFAEFKAIKKMMLQSNRGLAFSDDNEAVALIDSLPELNGALRMATLIHILEKLSAQKPEYLSSVEFVGMKGEANEKRINKICAYIQHHFNKPLQLEKVAAYIHLSPSAFCKFMKRASGKTFSDYVNDVRIAHACKLLTETDKPVRTIAFSCGFESLTYFNRVFLKKKHITPNMFRQKNS